MNSIQIIILAIGLAMNSFMSFFFSGASLKLTDFDQKLRIWTTIFIAQVLMLGAGLWLGIRIGILAENYNYKIALCILLFIGLKIIFESIRSRPENISILTEKRELIIFSLSEGILPLLLGIAVGMVVDVLMTAWIILIIFQTIALIAGFYLSSRNNRITFGIKLEIIGGFILLAAALKMLISLIGY